MPILSLLPDSVLPPWLAPAAAATPTNVVHLFPMAHPLRGKRARQSGPCRSSRRGRPLRSCQFLTDNLFFILHIPSPLRLFPDPPSVPFRRPRSPPSRLASVQHAPKPQLAGLTLTPTSELRIPTRRFDRVHALTCGFQSLDGILSAPAASCQRQLYHSTDLNPETHIFSMASIMNWPDLVLLVATPRSSLHRHGPHHAFAHQWDT